MHSIDTPEYLRSSLKTTTKERDVYGSNPAVGSTIEEVWANGGIKIRPNVAGILEISSSDNEDSGSGGVNPPGIGVRKIRVYGLVDDYVLDEEEPFEDIVLDGTNPVFSTKNFVQVIKSEAIEWGAGRVAQGDITGQIDSNDQFSIIQGKNQTSLSQQTIPKGYNGIITRMYLSSVRSTDVDFNFQYQLVDELGWKDIRQLEIKDSHVIVSNTLFTENGHPFPEKTAFRITAKTINSTARVSAGYTLEYWPV